jgi:uncharacterized RDD family membrane protein YckC
MPTRWLDLLGALALMVGTAGAQTGTEPTERDQRPPSHGWIAAAAVEGTGGALLHLPPRSTDGAESGQAWLARSLERTPRETPDWGGRAYLVYDIGGGRLDIYTLNAVRPMASGAWQVDPPGGARVQPRLDLTEALGQGAEFRGSVGSAGGLLVLGQSRESAWGLAQLSGGSWTWLELPEPVRRAETLWLVEEAERPTLLEVNVASFTLWSCDGGGEGSEGGSGWERTPLAPGAFPGPKSVRSVFLSGGDVVLAHMGAETDTLVVEALGPGLVGPIVTVELPSAPLGIEPLDRGRRLAILAERVNPRASGISEPIRAWELVEVSLATGRELYRGEPRFPTIPLAEGVRLLSLGMMALTGCLLFYVLRPGETDRPVVMPEGWALATPPRRFWAGALDLALVIGVVSSALRVPVGDFLLLLPLLESARGVIALGLTIVGGSVYGTASEWILGATLGKLALGVRVVSVDAKRPRVGLLRAAARNVFRWALAPWALLGMASPPFRHRGDVVAFTAVVVRRPDEAPPSEG